MNKRAVIQHAHLLSSTQLLSYFINQAHCVLAFKDQPDLFLELTLRLLARANLTAVSSDICSLIECVFLKFSSESQKAKYCPLLFDALVKAGLHGLAYRFATKQEEILNIEETLEGIEAQSLEKYVLRLAQLHCDRKTLSAFEEKVRVKNALTDDFAQRKEMILAIDSVNTRWDQILNRVGNKQLEESRELLRNILDFSPKEIHFVILNNFLDNIPKIVSVHSQQYIVMLVKEIIPDFRFDDSKKYEAKILKVLENLGGSPLLRDVLVERLELMNYFNM